MKQFDYKEFLKENKSTFHSSLNEDASATARKFAQHMSKKEGKKFTVTPGSVDEKSFDLDVDGEEYMGGSYLVKDNGDIVNVAAGNEVYGNVNQLEEGEAAYEYEKGKEAGEKMKKSELKEIYIAHLDKELDMSILSYMADVFISNAKDGDKRYKQFIDLTLRDAIFDVIGILNSKRHPLYKDALEEYNTVEADKARGLFRENKSQSKMKKSDLKAKIKEMILAEQGKKVEEVDFLAEIEDMLGEEGEFYMEKSTRIASFIRDLNRLVDEYHAELYLNDNLFDAISMVIKAAKEEAMNLNEAEGDEEVDVDVEAAADTTTVDVSTDEVDPNVKAVQDALTQAQAAAQDLNDPKLSDQIGNTITFFTRSHIVKKPGGAVTESMFPMLKKILK
jgi:hypothetical protein